MRLADRVRADALRMVARAGASHIGSSLSAVDILSVLYGGEILRVDPANPGRPDRDRLIFSKGHAAAACYAVLAESGFFPTSLLDSYCRNGSPLCGHVTSKGVPGVELSTGSLGHGLPVGCGMALAAARENKPWRVFVLMSDGECDEGSNWEAALFAGHHKLDNLTAIIDCNALQGMGEVKDILDLEPLADKWRSFRWAVREIDGHDHALIRDTLNALPVEKGKPSMILARTVKGKGVGFMENKLEWHYKSPDAAQLKQALDEVEKNTRNMR